jgi:predicted transcriptional regulator YdeE
MQLNLGDFEIIGIAIRTTNQNGEAEKDIGALWKLFYADDSLAKIEGKINDDLYCVYTDYDTDYTGAFTTILGYRMIPGTLPPSGYVRKIILKSTYQVFITQGPLPASVQKTWMNVWKTDIIRRYTSDFDVYGSQSNNPDNAIVRTFVSIE